MGAAYFGPKFIFNVHFPGSEGTPKSFWSSLHFFKENVFTLKSNNTINECHVLTLPVITQGP